MRPAASEAGLLRQLAETPLCDRLELVSLSGWSRGAVYPAVARLERAGLVQSLPHASPLIAPTRRYHLTAAGVRALARAEGAGVEELLRARPVSRRWRRILLERLDAVTAVYRLASAIVERAWPPRLRWYRAQPMDAAIALPDGRTLFAVRQGAATERTAFAKRLWRLREGPRPGAYLLLAPDMVRLRRSARLMARAPAPAFLALERDAVRAGTGARVWRTAAGSPWLSLAEVLSHVSPRGAWPAEAPLARVSLPPPLPEDGGAPVPPWLLPARLAPVEQRALDLLANWPWIAREPLAALLGVGRTRLAGVLARLGALGLLAGDGGDRLVLSDRGLALLARRDRASAVDARMRWSAAPRDPEAPPSWRNVSGRRSRQLLRTIEHTAAVHGFVAQLAAQARARRWELLQLDPPHRSSRYFRRRGVLRSVHPDAFAMLRREGESRACFIEWERRAVRPSTMAARLAPYLRYYASRRPTDDHGLRPGVLVVFEDDIAADHFLRVARQETASARVDLPLLVSHRALLEREGPLGAAWRSPGDPAAIGTAFG